MAARVALLLAFTGFFAVAWESDQKAEAKTLAAKIRLPERPVFGQKTPPEIAVSQVSRGLVISSESDFSNCVLPNGIVPGTYRVVDGRGSVGWVTIPERNESPEPLLEVVSEPKRLDFFSSQNSDGRWYFIRAVNAPVIASPQGESSVLR